MTENKKDTKSIWTAPDDAPELGDEWFDAASLYDGDKLIRRGRQTKINDVLKEWANENLPKQTG